MTAYPGRWLVALAYGVWLLCVLYIVACLAARSFLGDTGCELAPGSSVFGEATRSWLPPGTTCTWDLSSFGLSDHFVASPSPVRLVVVAMALTGLPVLRYLSRLLRHPLRELVDA